MRKEDICVLIDDEKKKWRALEILSKAKEKMGDMSYNLKWSYLKFNSLSGAWFVGLKNLDLREVSLDELEEILILTFPKQMWVWDEIEDHKTIKTVVDIYKDQYVVEDDKSYLTYLNASTVSIPIKEYICGHGEVSIGVGKDFISFSVLSSPRKVGEDITGILLPESDLTKIYFENLESLEVLQGKVNELRERLKIKKQVKSIMEPWKKKF